MKIKEKGHVFKYINFIYVGNELNNNIYKQLIKDAKDSKSPNVRTDYITKGLTTSTLSHFSAQVIQHKINHFIIVFIFFHQKRNTYQKYDEMVHEKP